MSDGGALDELRRRLDEAEETLRAIREGEVDALVVRSNEQDQVFHLGGGGESYRAFMEAMEIGAAALGHDGTLVYANAALQDLLGASAQELAGANWRTLFGAAAQRIEALIAAAQAGKQSAQVVLEAGGARRHVIVAAAPLPMSFGSGTALTLTDITARVETEAAEESERVGRAVMASANEAVVICDADGVITHANPAVQRILAASPLGQLFEHAFPLAMAPGAGAMQAEDLLAIAQGGSAIHGVEASLLLESGRRDVLVSAVPLRPTTRLGGCIVTLVDQTERKALEKRQALLMGELDHRIRNMLALVLSISSRTLRNSKDLAEFGTAFTQRINALAATQNLLADRSWGNVQVEEIVTSELAPFVAPRGSRVRLDGLAFEVSRDTAVALGLVIHELVTNAVKHGALSNESGRIIVEGSASESDTLEIVWREEGGPLVRPPERRGFGQSVISRGLGQHPGTGATVEFRPEGLVCRMKISVARG